MEVGRHLLLVLVVMNLFALVYTSISDGNVKQDPVVAKIRANGKPNILFLVADDMRPQLGCYKGDDHPSPVSPKMITPNLDKLAERSLLLRRAYVQQALCAPSRTSLLTGRRPDTTHVYGFDSYWRKQTGNFTTLPQYFKENGYHTVGIGKVFHDSERSSGLNACDQNYSWSEPCYFPPNHNIYSSRAMTWMAVNQNITDKLPLPDQQIAEETIRKLRSLASGTTAGKTPFFLAVGFLKPHLPFIFPEKFMHLYPNVSLPPNMHAPVNMPDIAWHNNRNIAYNDLSIATNFKGGINDTLPNFAVEQLRRAYYSCVSYTDSLIGQVLDELKNLGLERNTIVSFFGDHGWHLGENGEWTKFTNFELSTHAPLMISIPGQTDQGIIARQLVEMVDLFPTLVEAAGLPQIPLCQENSTDIPVCREGNSLIPLLSNPSKNGKLAVFSQFPREDNKVMGYSLRTNNYRFTEWVGFSGKPYFRPLWNQIRGIELYDHNLDPEENVNRAGWTKYSKIQTELHDMLIAGWRNQTFDINF